MADNKVDDGLFDEFELKKIDQRYLDNLYEKADGEMRTVYAADAATKRIDYDCPQKPGIRRYARLVALLAIVLLTSTGFVIYTLEQNASASKDQNGNLIEMKDDNGRNVVGKDANVATDNISDEIVMEEWDDVLEYSKTDSTLIIPEDMPQDYKFKYLKVENYSASEGVRYFNYLSEDRGDLIITQYTKIQEEKQTLNVNNDIVEIEVDNYKVSVMKSNVKKNIVAVFFHKENKFSISGEVSNNEIVAIIKSIIM